MTWATVTDIHTYLTYAGNGVVFFTQYSSGVLLILDYDDPLDVIEYRMPYYNYGYPADRADGRLYIVMGRYGVVTIDRDR